MSTLAKDRGAAAAPAALVDMKDPAFFGGTDRIAAARAEGAFVAVDWADGHSSRFLGLWLRDNCHCPVCRHPDALERTVDIVTLPEDIMPEEIAVTAEGALTLTWPEDETGERHDSAFDPSWLRAHCPSPEERAQRKRRPITWGAEIMADPPTVTYEEVMRGKDGLRRWLDLLDRYGFAILKGAPTEPEQIQRLTGLFGFPRETNFGSIFEVRSVPKPISAAYTAINLNGHIDLPYWERPPDYQFLFCLKNETTGGRSVMVDAFRVAEALRAEHPEAFDVLSRVPFDFRYVDEEVDVRYRAPMIGLDADGDLTEVRFSIAVMDAVVIPEDEIAEAYRAYKIFAGMMRDPRFEIRFRLESGDLMGFFNRRVLHGREAFDPTSGERHLRGIYIDRDMLLSKLRVLERGGA